MACVFLLNQSPGKGGGRCSLSMHDIDLGRWRAQGECVVIIGCGSSHDVVSGRSSFSQDDAHMGDIGLLDRVNQGLPQA
jgi:hypothetical protein